MTPQAIERMHLLLECTGCLFALGALALVRHGRGSPPSGHSPSSPGQSLMESPREEAILEQAKTQAALLREVNHRVRNDFTSLISLLQVKRDYARTPEEAGHLRDMEARLAGLAAIHGMFSMNGWRPIGLGELCRMIIRKATDLEGIFCEISIATSPDDVLVAPSQGHHLCLILNELASNAVHHGNRPGKPMALQILVESREDGIRLTFADNGPGYPEPILRNLSTSRGSGLQIIHDLVTSSLKGSFTLSNRQGAVACITFPLEPSRPDGGVS